MEIVIEDTSTPQAVFALNRNAETSNSRLFNVKAPAPVMSEATDERISEFQLITDCVNLLLVQVDCPADLRAFIDAIIGVAGERNDEWFHANDKLIAQRMEMSEKTVQRRRNELTAWQNENRVTFIQIEDEYTDSDGKRHPHRYRALISRMAVEILDEARTDSLEWRKNHGVALQMAAKRKRDEFPDVPARTHRGRKFEPDAETVITKSLKTAATNLLKAKKTIDGIELHRSIYGNDEPYMLNPELLNIMRHVLDDLSSRTPGNDGGNGDGESVHQPSSSMLVDTAAGIDARCVSTEESGGQLVHVEEARRAVEVFESVGAASFSVTIRDEQTHNAEEYKTLDARSIDENLERYLRRNADTLSSFIVRPRDAALIQVDDVTGETLERVKASAFLIAETSANNFQAWIALPPETDPETLSALRRRVLDRIGADSGASGAMRWPGSINHKPERDGFRVRLRYAQAGRTVTASELDSAGLLAPAPRLTKTTTPISARISKRIVPDYQECLASKGFDRSRADQAFMRKAFLRGFTKDEAIRELERVSERAQEERRRGRSRYFDLTSSYAGY